MSLIFRQRSFSRRNVQIRVFHPLFFVRRRNSSFRFAVLTDRDRLPSGFSFKLVRFFLADGNIEKAVHILKAVMNALIGAKLGAYKLAHINEFIHSVMHSSFALFADSFQS